MRIKAATVIKGIFLYFCYQMREYLFQVAVATVRIIYRTRGLCYLDVFDTALQCP